MRFQSDNLHLRSKLFPLTLTVEPRYPLVLFTLRLILRYDLEAAGPEYIR